MGCGGFLLESDIHRAEYEDRTVGEKFLLSGWRKSASMERLFPAGMDGYFIFLSVFRAGVEIDKQK